MHSSPNPRKDEHYAGAGTERAVHLDPAVRALDEAFHHWETNPAEATALGGEKRIEGTLQRLIAHADTAVLDPHLDQRFSVLRNKLSRPDRDSAAIRH